MKVSITLPTLHEKLAELVIDKIYETTENIDYEIVVVSPFEMSGPNIKWVPETEAKGNCGAHATAWEASEGDIIVPMCDDVFPTPGCFQEMMAFLIEREKIYFPYSCGLHLDMGHIGTVFCYYYPYFPALSRRTIEKIGGYYLRDYTSHFGDCDIGLRVWDEGGRCELCETAKIYPIEDYFEDRLGIQSLVPNVTISLKVGQEFFLEKWRKKYGQGWRSELRDFNLDIPLYAMNENTICKGAFIKVKQWNLLKYLTEKLKEPINIESQRSVGSSYLRIEEVISTYRYAINQNPNFPWYVHELGNALLKLGNLEEAIVAYNYAVKIKPNSATFHLSLGDALLKKGSLDEAISHYQTAIKLKPDLPLVKAKVLELRLLGRSLKHIICRASSTMKEIYGPQNLFWGDWMIWHSQRPPQYPEWLEVELLEPQKCQGISIKPQQGNYERAPSTFTIMGSNDKQEWKSLLSVSDYKWASDNWQ